MAKSFGVNSPIYQKGEPEILAWINDLLDMDVKVVEEMGTGTLICHLLDAMFPAAEVPMASLKWGATSPATWDQNWSKFRDVKARLDLGNQEKNVDVPTLEQCKRAETLALAQWAYGLFNFYYPDGGNILPDYDAKARRHLSKTGRRAVNEFKVVDMHRSGNLKSQARKNGPRIAQFRQRDTPPPVAGAAAPRKPAAKTRGGLRPRPAAAGRPKPAAAKPKPAAKPGISQAVVDELQAQLDDVQAQLETLQEEHERLTEVSQAVESERDFYFGKVEASEKIVAPPVAEDEDVNDVIDALDEPEEMKEMRRRILEVLWEQQEDAAGEAGEEVLDDGEEVYEEEEEDGDDVAY